MTVAELEERRLELINEERAVNPPKLRGYTSAERKQMPVHTIIAEYFPDAIAAVSRHSLKANDKHNPGQPMGWSRDKSTDHLNCAGRHLMTPRAVDPDTGEEELVGATWRCLAALQLREEARLAAAGIMPLSGQTPAGEPAYVPTPCPQHCSDLSQRGFGKCLCD